MIYLISFVIIISLLPIDSIGLGWEFSMYSREIIISCMSIIAAYACSWTKVKIKSVLIVNAFIQVCIGLSCPVATFLWYTYQYEIPYYTTFIVVLSGILWSLSRYTKHIRSNSDTIDNEHYFYGLYMPSGFNGVVQCLFSSLYGGICVYGDGCVWRFRRGYIVKCKMLDVNNKNIIWINTHVKKDDHFDKQLDELVGCKWKFHNNCFNRLTIFQDYKKLL